VQNGKWATFSWPTLHIYISLVYLFTENELTIISKQGPNLQ